MHSRDEIWLAACDERPGGAAVLLATGFSPWKLTTSNLHPVVGVASISRCSDSVGSAAYRAQSFGSPYPRLKPGVIDTAHLRRAHHTSHASRHTPLPSHRSTLHAPYASRLTPLVLVKPRLWRTQSFWMRGSSPNLSLAYAHYPLAEPISNIYRFLFRIYLGQHYDITLPHF